MLHTSNLFRVLCFTRLFPSLFPVINTVMNNLISLCISWIVSWNGGIAESKGMCIFEAFDTHCQIAFRKTVLIDPASSRAGSPGNSISYPPAHRALALLRALFTEATVSYQLRSLFVFLFFPFVPFLVFCQTASCERTA